MEQMMARVSQAFSILKNLLSVEKPQNSLKQKNDVNGIMFVSKPRGAKDDNVRIAQDREEAQVLAKKSALIVDDKSKFLPRSGVSVRTRQHVIFDFKANEIVIQMPLASESEKLVLKLPVQHDKITACKVDAPMTNKEMKPKKRADHIATLSLAIESLSLLNNQSPTFVRLLPILQRVSTQLLDVAREKLDEVQAPIEEEIVNTATFQKALDEVPKGAFVVRRIGSSRAPRGVITIHEGLEPLKLGERIYALTQEHSQVLSNALGEGSAHARVAAMRLLEKVSADHPAALPVDIASTFTEFKTDGNVLARLESLKEMSEEDQIGEVYLLNHRMIDTYSSYRLPYGYEYGKPWHDRLEKSPLVLTRKRSSLRQRPAADLITLDGILCVSEKAKPVLEELDLGASKFHYIQETDDYWAMEITEFKSGPIPDESLYQVDKNGNRTPRPVNGKTYFGEGLDYLVKRARFGPEDMIGPDVWLCEEFALGYRHAPAIVFSKSAISALKKAKCKWYKRVHPARVVDL